MGEAPAAWKVILATVGLLGIAVGTLLPIVNVHFGPGAITWWKYIYAGGALCFLVGKLLTRYTGIHPRIRRLVRIESWSAIFFCVAAFFIFYRQYMTNDAWAFTLAGGILLVFTTLAIPSTANKELKRARNAGKEPETDDNKDSNK